MSFVKGAWKILVGIKDALALILLLMFFALLFAILSSRPNAADIKDGALMLKLQGTIAEQPATPDPFAALFGDGPVPREYAVRDLTRAIEAAKDDARVKAVVLDLDGFLGGGQASIATVGRALDDVKKAGKPVYAYATAYANDGYQLAAHSSEIWVDPMGGALVAGPGGSGLYYGDALDKYGIKAHVYRVGTYKSAVEPFTGNKASEPAKQALTALLGEVWEDWQAEVIKARPQAKLQDIIARPAEAVESANGNLAELALRDGFVDKLGTRAQFGDYIARKVGKGLDEAPGSFAQIDYDDWLDANEPEETGDAIGLVTIAGTIVDGEAGPGTAGGDSVSELIYDALANDDLKALVVRVDSPGGSVLASEQIRLAIQAAKDKGLPVVISMANLAASGGYWISTPGDAIFAEPETITGSIGIFAILPSFEEALGKFGVSADGVKTTPLSGEPDIFAGPNETFDRVAQSTIENGYRDFLTRVAKSRHMTTSQVDAIGQGRVWAGGTARQLGLVDRLGGLDEAIAEAAKRAKLKTDDYHVRTIEEAPDPFAEFLTELSRDDDPKNVRLDLFGHAAMRQRQTMIQVAATAQELVGTAGAQARCIECELVVPRAARIDARGGWAALLAKWF
ncbi:signal peptide peptidase SppA [Novosphingopyxis sp.]|uniref:signal peptide peptidase SppA n=1 Tax=Novosphingopyxis sp. TaxID=2709690 RepID=UPI003B5B79AB